MNLALTPLRYSYLRTLGTKSPRHLMAVEPEPTKSMTSGTAFHAITLGSKQRIIEYPKRRQGKAWDEFEAENADALILSSSEWSKANAMADAVRAHPLASRALEGVRESTILWRCAGIECRATPDVLGKRHVTELKQAKTADPRWFVKDALKMGYTGQLSFYDEAAHEAFPKEYPSSAILDHLIVAVEPVPPYVVQVYRVTDRAKEQARKQWWAWFERFKSCVENNHWPAYSDRVEEIDVPEELPGLTFADDEDEDGASDGPALEVAA